MGDTAGEGRVLPHPFVVGVQRAEVSGQPGEGRDVLFADGPGGREVLAALSQILEIRGHPMSRTKFGRTPTSPAGVKTTCTCWSQAMSSALPMIAPEWPI